MKIDKQQIKERLRKLVTQTCLDVIQLVNPGKNEGLAYRLHYIAGSYQKSSVPWFPPRDWKKSKNTDLHSIN